MNARSAIRGQGIGVIIDFIRDVYIKLWQDRNKASGFSLYLTGWAHTHSKAITEQIGTTSDPTFSILHSDLSLGYDVYIIDYKGQEKNWCEPRTQKDDQATPILFSTFQQYAQYNPAADHSNSSSDADSDAEINSAKFHSNLMFSRYLHLILALPINR